MNLLLDTVTTPHFLKQYLGAATLDKAHPQKSVAERIAVIGLGYVGLPLAVSMAYRFAGVIGLDISADRIRQLASGFDATGELSPTRILGAGLTLTDDPLDIADATFFIVTVPTPITATKQPDLEPLRAACRAIAPSLKKGDAVVFESTVYPGVTEEVCGALLQDLSGLRSGIDFSLGYSPERINPGDKVNTVEKITKIVSGDTPASLARISSVYETIIEAGVYRCPSIKVAEGAKVLENTQRDVNIALMNELSLICDKIGIATSDVIAAAATKWNFVPFTPGLVGGHCIGVDPYYLAALAEQVGHHPEVILAGRRLNDNMVHHVTAAIIRQLIKSGCGLPQARIGIAGITFKENVPDIRNSKAIELIAALESYGLHPLVHDALCEPATAKSEGILLTGLADMGALDMLVLASPHAAYLDDPAFLDCLKPGGILIDVRGAYAKRPRPDHCVYWSL